MDHIRKILKLIDKNDFRNYLILIFFSIIAIILETLSIAVVIPLVSVIIEPNFLNKYQNTNFDKLIPDMLFNLNHETLVMIILIFFGFVFFSKNIYLMFYNYLVALYANNLKAKLTSKLLDRYLYQNYLFHVNRKYSNFIANLTSEASHLTRGILVPSLVLITEILLLIVLLLLIVIFRLYEAIFIFAIFGIVGIILISITKKYSTTWSKLREKEEKNRVSSLNKLLSGIRDIILIGKRKNLLEIFNLSEKNVAKFNIKFDIFIHIPKYVFETIGIFGLIASIIFLKSTGSTTFEILTAASFFIATSYRAIPSLNKIITSYQLIKYYSNVVDLLANELSLEKSINFSDAKLSFNKQIKISNLSFKYKDTNYNVLDNINITINKKSIIGIIGSTGSGKSTLIDIISGLIRPQTGRIVVDDLTIENPNHIRRWQNNLSYVSQNTYLMDDTIKNNIAFGLNPKDIDEALVMKAIENSQLENFIDTLPNKINTYVGDRGVSLSGGQIQRIGIARAIYRNSDFLILDEITSALDKKTERLIVKNIVDNKKDQTIIIVTHNTDLLDYCDEVYKIEKNSLIKKEL